ncbi:acyl-CoA desaturase [Gangjinia marincola]|uniref:Acyl-CoA desaturase n=1 Tax=Gangjinia marincola TaxID=578463 RepID=A0ABP3XUX3_9FLAO
MNTPTVKFSRRDTQNFFRTLNKRVNTYFKENNIKRTANWKLHLKTVIMFCVFLAPYFLILTLDVSDWWKLLFTIIMGVGMAGIGMNVMHDGNHGSYSNKKWVNKIIGGSMYLLGGSVYNWQVQHNVLHHTYTNIHGHDEDLDAGRVIRFSKHAPWYSFQKYQHYYSVFLYGLLTFNWILVADFKQTKRYLARKLSYGEMPSKVKQWSTVAITKVVYLSLWIAIPMIVGIIWWKVLLGFFIMHYVAGLILSIVFQLAHVVEGVDMPIPDESGNMKNTWAIHQLFTTTNFSTKNPIMNWFTGGLNHQVEHHIFPNISHVHYNKISKIVKSTAKEFDLPYLEYKTTRAALKAHFSYLKQMGQKPVLNA